jgi:Flp pilus assembly protein TadG
MNREQMAIFLTDTADSQRQPKAHRRRLPRLLSAVAAGRSGALMADRSGAAAAEFALLLPVLTLLLTGVMQYGVLYYSYNSMLNTARNGARSLAIGTATPEQVVTTAKANLPKWVPAGEWVITPKVQGTRVTTQITVPSRYATIMRLAPMPDTLEVNVEMVKEV